MLWRSFAVACVVLVALGTSSPNAVAIQDGGDTATLTIHYRECEAVPVDGDWYDACHDIPFPGATLGVISEETLERTAVEGDDSGNLTFDLPPGTYRLDGPPGHALDGQELFCSAGDTPGTEVPHPVTLAAGESVTCDLYIVQSCLAADPAVCDEAMATEPAPAETAASGNADAGAETTESAPPASQAEDADQLAAIYAGACDDLGDPVTDLTELETPEGDAVGAEAAVPVATSFTTLDLALDDILGVDHAVAVFDPEDPETVVACGGVGGVLAGDGSLAVGLAEADDSGNAGVAYLAPDGEQTVVTVFLTTDEVIEDDGTPTVA